MYRLISILILSCFLFTTNALPVAAAISYTYDQNGNMTSDGTLCFEYNEANQMSKVKNCADNKTIAEYIYDYSGKRLVKKEYENGVLKQTIYSPTDEYETKKIEGGATENTVYYKANTEVIAKKNPDGSINYYHNDHLGSTTVLTDQAGNMIEKSAYEPYGEVKQGGTKSKFGYTGQEKDNETGLNYYDARYYDPHLQRFIQPDTLLPDIYDPQQLNRYAYARNNPLKYTDPTGHIAFLAIPLAYWVVGAFIGAAAAYSYTPHGQQVTKAAITKIAESGSQLISKTIDYGKNLISNSNSKPSNPSTQQPQSPASKGSNSPQVPNNPFEKIAPLVPQIVNDGGNKWKTNSTVNQGLKAAETWLGKGYKEIDDGVFRSLDNLRQFRMTNRDILNKKPHFNFETIGSDGRKAVDNLHMYLIDINK